MAFWSGEKLASELSRYIHPFDREKVDCSAYRLSVGEQVFVTSSKHADGHPTDPLIDKLSEFPNHTIRIPPGQFAFLLTNEFVKVPSNAMAFISIRAKYKFKGIINVSGFHVDPGWRGKLIFSVYNAGPADVILEKGEDIFLIVYADLDRASSAPYLYDGKSLDQDKIDKELVQNLTTQVFSPAMLKNSLDSFHDKVSSFESRVAVLSGGAVAIGVIIGLIFAGFALLPKTPGIVIARTLDEAGYEIKDSSKAKDDLEKKAKVDQERYDALMNRISLLEKMAGVTK